MIGNGSATVLYEVAYRNVSRACCSDVVYLTVTLLFEGKTIHDLSGRCAANKSIREFIQPQVQRKLGCQLLNQQRRLVIGMYCRAGRDWSSPCWQFKVSAMQRDDRVLMLL